METQTTILITGANRGIGRAITNTYLSRPNHTIIALVRDHSHETSRSLFTDPKGDKSVIITLPYDASQPSSPETTITSLQKQRPDITHIDMVIANAGFSAYFGPSLDATPDTYIQHYTVNTLAPLMLFRACLPLLIDTNVPNTPRPRFIFITSGAGSTTLLSSATIRRDTTGQPRRGGLPYTSSKCALNHVAAKLYLEYPEVNVGLFTPGPTKTGFGGGNVNWDVVPGVQGIEKVVDGLVGLFDGLRGEGKGDGEERLRLRDWSGKEFDW